MSIFEFRHGNSTFIFPAFKFQEQQYADSMLNNGNVHLSNISIFRDTRKFSGKILDIKEGIVTLHNRIKPIKNEYIQSCKHAFPTSVNININDAYIFCCTKYFLSDSLTWAISEGKQCCVLITDVNEYIHRISLHYQASLNFRSARECEYIGRDFYASTATPYDRINKFINEPLNAVFVKPKEYAPQKELRILWTPKSNIKQEEYLNSNIETKDLLIKVLFHNFNIFYKSSRPSLVGARIIKKDGRENAKYEIRVPEEVFSPVIHSKKGHKMLGFLSLSRSNIFIDCLFKGSDIPIIQSPIGNIVCNVYLNDIEHIEIYTLKL